jgi:hypothetical protein
MQHAGHQVRRMSIALAQTNMTVGALEGNVGRMLVYIQ